MNKTALITGASSGIGYELARLFAADGNNLVLVARSKEKLEQIKEEREKEFGVTANVIVCDLSKEGAASEVFSATSEQNIQIDYLVNNAGFGDFGKFHESNLEKQSDMISVNITALTELSRLYLPHMVEQGFGNILNVASIAAFQAGPLMSVYYATKAFVVSLTEALSVELKGTGVKVTALCPGPTKTGFEDSAKLENSGLFKNLKAVTARDVALYGYKKMKKGKLIAIHGFMNRVIVCASKFAPRALVRNVVYNIQK